MQHERPSSFTIGRYSAECPKPLPALRKRGRLICEPSSFVRPLPQSWNRLGKKESVLTIHERKTAHSSLRKTDVPRDVS